MKMEYLEVKPQATPEEARNHPSLGLVYNCPKCKVGQDLQHVSMATGKVKCTRCDEIYLKP